MASIQNYLLHGVRSVVWTILGNCLSELICDLSDPQIVRGGSRLWPYTQEYQTKCLKTTYKNESETNIKKSKENHFSIRVNRRRQNR